jgi:predicted amidohydrolase
METGVKRVPVEQVTVACVQQRMRLHDSIAAYRDDLRRFLRAAQNKHAHLVIFPELAGTLVAPPLLRDLRSTLLKRADQGRRKQASLWLRLTGALAGQGARWLGADLRRSLQALLAVAAADAWESYANLFSELAREFNLVLVAPSGYLPDPSDGTIRNLAAVFGPDGTLLGHQAKVLLHPEDEGLAYAGDQWTPIATPVGLLGLMVGGDVLYPEVGRVLAYQGAEALILVGAATTPVLYQKLRAGMLARMQDNQLYGVASFVVGHNELGVRREPFVGKSALFAPQELTPRFNGVLVEMGSQHSEGVLTAEWDFAALRQLWERSDTPLRRQLPLAQAGQVLAKLYERLKSLPRSQDTDGLLALADDEPLAASVGLLSAAQTPLSLEELPVIGVVTRRWSGVREAPAPADGPLELSELPEERIASADLATPLYSGGGGAPHTTAAQGADDETDEMDALPEPAPDPPR